MRVLLGCFRDVGSLCSHLLTQFGDMGFVFGCPVALWMLQLDVLAERSLSPIAFPTFLKIAPILPNNFASSSSNPLPFLLLLLLLHLK